jgi:hypothetical protein
MTIVILYDGRHSWAGQRIWAVQGRLQGGLQGEARKIRPEVLNEGNAGASLEFN